MNRERGNTLVLALLSGVLLGGLAVATYIVVSGQTQVARERARMLQAQALAEAAMALKMQQIGDDNLTSISGVFRVPPMVLDRNNRWVPDWEPGGADGILDAADAAGYQQQGAWRVNVRPVTGMDDTYTVDASATVQGGQEGTSWTRAIIAVVFRRPRPPSTADGIAAVASRGMVTITGNMTVDGRNKINIQPDPTLGDTDDVITAASAMAQLFPPNPGDAFDPVDPDGTWGIKTESGVDVQGAAAAVGGQGHAPVNNPADGQEVDTGVAEDGWGDGVDNDGDGAVDEEAFDGIDNDGDDKTDEDTNSFPTSADVVVGAPEGTLKATAQYHGTYFTTLAQFNAWVAANGGGIVGGKVIYLDFKEAIDMNFGDGWINAEPSIIVHHHLNPTTGLPDGYMKNLHGMFKGIVLADQIDHVNGDALILGGVMTLSDDGFGHWFGNGDADIIFSSGVLANLPGLIDHPPEGYKLLSWQEVVR